LRGHESRVGRRISARRRSPGPEWAGDGSPQRTHVPGVARGLSADWPPRILFLLRGLHSHRGLDVQSAREMAEGMFGNTVAQTHSFFELSADLTRLAPGS